MAHGAFARLWRWHPAVAPGRDGPVPSGSAGVRRRADHARQGRRAWSIGSCPTSPTGAGSSPRCWRCWAPRRRQADPSSCSRPGARSSSGWPHRTRWSWCSRTSTGRTVARWTSSTTCSTGRAACPSSWSPSPVRSCSSAAPTGARRSASSRACSWSHCRRGRCRAHRRASSPVCRRRRDRPSWRARTGCPLYAVETVRMLVADGRLVLRDGVYTPNGDLTQLAIPDSLTALIAARLDALDPADRSLILDASVLGQSFTPAALAAVQRHRAGAARTPAARAGPARAPGPGGRPPLARAGPVRVRPVAHPRSRLRHARATRSQGCGTSPRLAGSNRWVSTSCRARSPVQYLAAHANASEDEEAAALAAQARIALRAAADRRDGARPFEQAASFLRQALAVDQR